MIKSRRKRWTGHVAHVGQKRNASRILMGKQEEKKPLGRPRRRWEYDIVTDLMNALTGNSSVNTV
jgi:hypothetical protein